MSTETLYRLRSRQHAPHGFDEMKRAAQDLSARGTGDHDIARILEVDVNAARRLIGTRVDAAVA